MPMGLLLYMCQGYNYRHQQKGQMGVWGCILACQLQKCRTCWVAHMCAQKGPYGHDGLCIPIPVHLSGPWACIQGPMCCYGMYRGWGTYGHHCPGIPGSLWELYHRHNIGGTLPIGMIYWETHWCAHSNHGHGCKAPLGTSFTITTGYPMGTQYHNHCIGEGCP